MTDKINISITTVILTWNSADFINSCLTSLTQSHRATDIIVVDNNSSDNTRSIVESNFPKVHLIDTGANLGYAGGNNVGIKQALINNTDYIFIINPDTHIDKNCIDALLNRMKNEKQLAAVSPKIYSCSTNDIWFAGAQVNLVTGNTPQLNGKDNGQYDAISYTERLTGCAMMVSKDAIKRVGLMDERFFLFYEETDWSMRFIKSGYRLGVEQSAKFWHNASASTGGYTSPLYHYYMTRNRLLFMQKHKPIMLPITYLVSILDSLLAITVSLKRVGSYRAYVVFKSILKGYVDFIFRKFYKREIPA